VEWAIAEALFLASQFMGYHCLDGGLGLPPHEEDNGRH